MQACIRRWLAVIKYKKNKEAAKSAVVLQRHVRGWLTRRKIKLLKEREQRERQEYERQQRLLREQQQLQQRQEQERMAKEKIGINILIFFV